MSDQLIKVFSDLQTFLPWVSFTAGLAGSFHCVGMCGGLVTASCQNTKDVGRYQAGRLLGYLLLGSIAGFLGGLLSFKTLPFGITLIPALLIGLLFISWGIQGLTGKKSFFRAPKFLGKIYGVLWKKMVQKNQNFSRAFFTGLLSLLLPCGLLYGVVLGTLTLNGPYLGLLSMFFFWLGTMPAMVLAPTLFQKVLMPFKKRVPKIHALGLVLLGLFTISMRVSHLHSHASLPQSEGKTKIHHCH